MRTRDELEKNVIRTALKEHGWNLTAVAKSLGISRAALYRKLREFKLSFPLE